MSRKVTNKAVKLFENQVFVIDPRFQDFLLAVKLGGNASNQNGGRDTRHLLCVVVIVCVCSNGLKHCFSLVISILRIAYEHFFWWGGGEAKMFRQLLPLVFLNIQIIFLLPQRYHHAFVTNLLLTPVNPLTLFLLLVALFYYQSLSPF